MEQLGNTSQCYGGGAAGNCVKQDLLIAFIVLYDVGIIVFLCFLDKRTDDFTLFFI